MDSSLGEPSSAAAAAGPAQRRASVSPAMTLLCQTDLPIHNKKPQRLLARKVCYEKQMRKHAADVLHQRFPQFSVEMGLTLCFHWSEAQRAIATCQYL